MNDPQAENIGSNLGMSSLVIGITGLFLFFLPILGIPLSLFGLAFGVIGALAACFVKGSSPRWSLGGIAVSALALAVNLALASAPTGAYLPSHNATPFDKLSLPPAGG